MTVTFVLLAMIGNIMGGDVLISPFESKAACVEARDALLAVPAPDMWVLADCFPVGGAL